MCAHVYENILYRKYYFKCLDAFMIISDKRLYSRCGASVT